VCKGKHIFPNPQAKRRFFIKKSPVIHSFELITGDFNLFSFISDE